MGKEELKNKNNMKMKDKFLINGWRYGVGLPCRLFQPYHYRNWQTAIYRLLCACSFRFSSIEVRTLFYLIF